MKKRNRLLALLLIGVFATTIFAGCGRTENKQQGKSATDIEISYWRAGLGVEWLDAVIRAFNEKYPEYNVYYNATASESGAKESFGLEDVDTVDLYMVAKDYNTSDKEPLNDVLDATVEGESKSIKEKFDASYLQMEEYEGNYYGLTYGGGILGFIYNTELFNEAGISQAPRTTDELRIVCSILADKNITPLCHYSQVGYYLWMQEVWFAQYDGFDYYMDFYHNPSKEKMIVKDGRYETVKAMEQFIAPEYVLKGSNSTSHTIMQTKFLEGEAAMMVNGSWLSTEMKQSAEKIEKFKMMKTPVISAIINKLTTVKNDSELRKLITAIDSVTDGVESIDTYKDGENYLVDGKNISAADWDYVKTARNMIPANYSGECCFIPSYSNAKEGAKEFLKFLYSDEGYKIYLDALHIAMPLQLSEGEIDTKGWNTFEKSQVELFEKTEYSISSSMMTKHPIFIVGGAIDAYANKIFANLYCASNEADRINAELAWDSIVSRVNTQYEQKWMLNIK